jgi:hypothetical protein
MNRNQTWLRRTTRQSTPLYRPPPPLPLAPSEVSTLSYCAPVTGSSCSKHAQLIGFACAIPSPETALSSIHLHHSRTTCTSCLPAMTTSRRLAPQTTTWRYAYLP